MGERNRQEEAAKVAADDAAKDAKAAAEKAVSAYLKKRGFKSLTASKKAFCGAAVYPLFLAVEDGEVELVKAMILCEPSISNQKNAAGKTARQVAERCNKNGSHESMLAALP